MNIKPLSIVAMACLMAAPSASATPQVKDLLIIRGKRIFTYDTPPLSEAFPKLKIPRFYSISTANRKGYTATWAVFQDQLYLIGFEGHVEHGAFSIPQMRWDEKILKGQVFPLKVKGWSGEVQDVTRGCWSMTEGSDKKTYYDLVSTVVFENGKVAKVEFDKEVPWENDVTKDQPSEQAGADQPAINPADKPPAENQPSTPTSKVVPR